MLPSGGSAGWADAGIPTILLPPRNLIRTPFISYSYPYTTDELFTVTRFLNGIRVTNSLGAVLVDIPVANALRVDLTFDQSDRYMIIWELAGAQIWMNWYNPVAGLRETIQVATGNNPCCAMDDRRAIFVLTSDIFIIYQRGNHIYYRLQRDRYLTEHEVPHTETNFTLDTCGMGENFRFTIITAYEDALILMAGNTPIAADDNIVGLPWGEIPWDKN